MVKHYLSKPGENYNIEYFRGAKFFLLNYRYTNENIVVYGAPQHEFFYGKFNNEQYHEFCYKEVSLNLRVLGLEV